jgi:hypothetical protein
MKLEFRRPKDSHTLALTVIRPGWSSEGANLRVRQLPNPMCAMRPDQTSYDPDRRKGAPESA